MVADREMKENIEYIIIDDPITSLDTENRYHLTKIINQFIDFSKSANKQVFVLHIRLLISIILLSKERIIPRKLPIGTLKNWFCCKVKI